MASTRYSLRSAEKRQTNYNNKTKSDIIYIIDSSDEEELTDSDSQHSTPRKTKAKFNNCDSTPPKQSKLNSISKNRKQFTSPVKTPSLERLSLVSPKKPKSSKKNLFKENESHSENTTRAESLNATKTSDSEPKHDEILPKTTPSAYQYARQALHGTFPTEMPGREKELAKLKSFIDEHLKHKTSGSIYVSGPPGTGKTASLNVILSELNVDSKVTHVYVNCTAIKSPNAIYSRIMNELKLTNKTEKNHVATIEAYLKRKHQPILLVLDEIDQLETKNQSILYTIFEWPSKPNSQLVLIGIANALDLTDRILPRLQTRCELKPELLHFAPYTKAQIVDIFTSRLKAAGVLDVFSPTAVQLLAGKVASISGDIRRALDIGRRVIELADRSRKDGALKSMENLASELINEETNSVDLKQVLTVLNNVYGTSQNLNGNVDDSIPLQQKIIICSLLLMLKKLKNKDITIGKLHDVYKRVCGKRKIGSVDQAEFVGLCSLIETRGILSITNKKEPRLNKVSLLWDEEEVTNVLKDKQLISEILQDTSCLGKF
ncbi:unnamed protein product [Phyllotreta striolata]|uniref:Cell division control protein n=1 Tax=Phyllotreta striolata TaxID=444603 RepID=A0A9N9XNJ1_PHYSR|nr:unnamed protein product [Phyllotreta striolata]